MCCPDDGRVVSPGQAFESLLSLCFVLYNNCTSNRTIVTVQKTRYVTWSRLRRVNLTRETFACLQNLVKHQSRSCRDEIFGNVFSSGDGIYTRPRIRWPRTCFDFNRVRTLSACDRCFAERIPKAIWKRFFRVGIVTHIVNGRRVYYFFLRDKTRRRCSGPL